MKRRRRLIIPGAAVVVLAAIGITGWRMVFSPEAQARRLAGELCGQGPSTVEGWLIKIRLLRPRDRQGDEIVDELAALGRPAVPPLIDALKHKDPAVRALAARALGRIGPDAAPAVPALIALIESEREAHAPWWTVAQPAREAVIALGRIGPAAAEAVPALIECLAVDGGSLSGATTTALARIGRPAIPQLISVLKERPSGPPRSLLYARPIRAQIALAKMGAPAVPALREALRDADGEARILVLEVFEQMGPAAAPAVPDVLERLKDSVYSVRYAAARTLGRIGPATPEVVPALIRCLDDPDTLMRGAAAEALGEIGPAAEQAIGPLAGAIRSGREGLNDNFSVIALGKLGPKAVDPLIEIMLGDGPSFLFAAPVFEHVGAPAVEPLIRALRSDHRYRYRAAEALGFIGEPARPAVPLLLEALNADTDDFPRACAAQALGRIGAADDPGVVPALVRLLDDRTFWSLRSEAAEALADLGPPAKAAWEALTAALKDDAPRVRRSAAVALVEIDAGGSARLAVPVLAGYLEALHKSGKHRGDSRVFRALGILGPAAAAAVPSLQLFEARCEAARRALAIIGTGADPAEDPWRVNGQREPEIWYPPERRKLRGPYRPDDGYGE